MADIFKGDYEGCYLGAFISPKLPETKQYYATKDEMMEFSEDLKKNVSMYVCFLSWEKDGQMSGFPKEWCDNVYDAGAVPHITWEPWDFDRACTKFSLDKITIGKCDDYIRSFAKDVKAYGKQIFLRWAQEMNGFWYPWDGSHNFNDPSRYIDAYRHIRDIFTEEGVTNIAWVWSPEITGDLAIDDPIYDFRNYYPGDEYVDWVGMDGLNFGPTQDAASEWKSFYDLFSEAYNNLKEAYPYKPMMICTMGSAELGGNKAEWVKDAFSNVKSMNKIKIISLFNIEKEANWCIDSSDESLESFRIAVSDPYFL